jgi:hypothetical protein
MKPGRNERCLRVTQVQVKEALLSAKAKSKGKSDQESKRISLTACGREQQDSAIPSDWSLVSIG